MKAQDHVPLTSRVRLIGIKGGHHAQRAGFLFLFFHSHLPELKVQLLSRVVFNWTLRTKYTYKHPRVSGPTILNTAASAINLPLHCSTITSRCHNVYTCLLPVLSFHFVPHQRTTKAGLLLPTSATLWTHTSITSRGTR